NARKGGLPAVRDIVPILVVGLLGIVPSHPVQAQTPKWKFMVFGDTRGTSVDSQVNTEVLTELASAATNEKPAFVVVLGDLVFSGDMPSFESWSNIMSPVYQAGIGVYPLRGN